jgi:O-antigen ligase
MWLNPYDIENRISDSGSPLDVAIFCVLILASIVVLFRRNINIPAICKDNIWITVFYVYCCVSILWSDFPLVSSKRLIKGLGNILAILIVLTEKNWVEALNKIMRRSGIILIPLSVIFIKYFPEIGRYYDGWTGNVSFSGVSYNKNGLGCLCLICGLFFFWNMMDGLKNRYESEGKKDILSYLVIFIMIIWLMYLANSATSLTCFLIGILIVSWNIFPVFRRNYKTILIVLSITGVFMYIFDNEFGFLDAYTASIGRDASFTGRDKIWELALSGVSNPWIGTGYESYWDGNKIKNIMKKFWDFPINEAHNGYLDVYLNLGYIGVVIIFAVILSACREILRKIIEHHDFGIFCLGFIIVLLIYNLTETAFKDTHPLWSLFLLMAIKCRFQIWTGGNYNDETAVSS